MSEESNPRLVLSYQPPAIGELDACLPDRILLGTRVYFDRADESTLAVAKTSKGQRIEVSIRFATPPALSFVCIRCPELKDANFRDEPRVVCSENQFLLLHLPLTFGQRWTLCEDERSEYFLYKAAGPGKSSLRLIPAPGPRWLSPAMIGICCCDAEEYILAALCPRSIFSDDYDLHTFSSKSDAWTVKPARLENPPMERDLLPASTHKVVPLGGTLLAWVDLLMGILTCDVASEDTVAVVSFIPLPSRMPGNKSEYIIPWKIRDVTCSGGSLKIIEVEVLFTQPQPVARAAPSDPDIVYDKDFGSRDLVSVPFRRTWIGWRAIIWNRVLSQDFWRKGCETHVADILVEDPGHLALLSRLGDGSLQNSPLMNLRPNFPTLSIFGDDVVYINSLERRDFEKAWVIAIDIRNKTVISLAPYPCVEPSSDCPHFPCVLSKYLSRPPAVPGIVQTSKSENVTANQSLRSCAEELITAPSGAQNCRLNFDHSSQNYRLNFDHSSVPQRSFRLLHVANNQRSFPVHKQSMPLPDLPHLPCWPPPGFVSTDLDLASNAHPAYHTGTFGQMVRRAHPDDGLLSHCPSQAPVLPPPFGLVPSMPQAPAAKSVLVGGRRNQNRHDPYRHPRQRISPKDTLSNVDFIPI